MLVKQKYELDRERSSREAKIRADVEKKNCERSENTDWREKEGGERRKYELT